ncbi:MAG: Crp/Fnr family transcriptional regulator [Methylobacterium mesophilicum]|nr:Crp/Fnr family transcriptional regulator [Methylobacterium mesophilicum]
MPSSFVSEMERHCRYVSLVENDVLVATEDPVDKVFFLLTGELRLSVYTRSGKVVSLRSAYPGEFIGDAALNGGGLSPYTAEAAKPSTLACVNARTFMEFAQKDARFLRAVFHQLVGRQVHLTEQIVELSTMSMHARLHKEIVRMCRENMKVDGSSIVYPMPTHSELARRIGTQREAVSREMSHLQQLGIIVRREGGVLYVPDVSRLIVLQMMLEE